jgi:hypothetical protein
MGICGRLWGKEGRVFFFEKKNQKTFTHGARASRLRRDSGAKVFCFFSSEKKTFFRLKGFHAWMP